MKNFTTLPPDSDFLGTLAEGVWKDWGGDGTQLADVLILLPTRRACRELRQAFLSVINKPASLLPRMQPLGDIDEEELYFSPDGVTDIPPAISPLRRQLLLAQLVAQKDPDLSLDQAARLAAQLALFLDQAQIEGCDLHRLPSLVEKKDLAEHWQQTVAFLSLVSINWPHILAQEGCIDPADRRNRVLRAQAEQWRRHPPAFPVIAAGSTGTIPATAELLEVIAGLSQGCVILPGLDQNLNEEAWQAVTPSHPQYGMKSLLEKSQVKREEVRVWGGQHLAFTPRQKLLQAAMLPAEVTEQWRELKAANLPASSFDHLTRIEAAHPQEEAQIIALAMRHALDTPGKTAALVTGDRDLAERVCAMLARWGIIANDSAGSSLSAQTIGTYLQHVLCLLNPQATTVDYLSFLKHPLTACGFDLAECRRLARHIEKTIWRSDRPETSEWLENILAEWQSHAASWYEKRLLSERLEQHIALAEKYATTDEMGGASRLWHEGAGESAAEWLNDLRQAAHSFPPVTGDEYAGLLTELMRQVTVRPAFGQHPRLSILGTLEARMIRDDLVILGGMNEGVWPPEAPVDPWMSRPMRSDFGLPSPERLIGLSAHDFVQLASRKEVLLTRSLRSGGSPTMPSRFLLQLETVLKAAGHSVGGKDVLQPKEAWQEWAHLLDKPQAVEPVSRPQPRPTVALRPRQLSVTDIGTWRRNPYAIYAKHILKLKKLDDLEAGLDAADRGNIIHQALEIFTKTYPHELPADALLRLLAIGKELFATYNAHPEVTAFWWPRFQRIAAWFVATEVQRRHSGIHILQSEAKGEMRLGDFTLKGRADRIDLLPDGSAEIIDYKTGGVPTEKEIQSGLEPQLALLGCMLEAGGFQNTAPRTVSNLAYWKLGGGEVAGDIKGRKGDAAQLMAAAKQGLENLLTAFGRVETPYLAVPIPDFMPRYDDYAHLARISEWGRVEEEPE